MKDPTPRTLKLLISPPLLTLLLQLALLMLAPRSDRWGTLAVLGLALIGSLTFIGALGEPINFRIFNPATFDPRKALLMAAMILLPPAILILGLLEWARRRREKYGLVQVWQAL